MAYLNLSILYKEKNQLSESIKILKKGINVSPNFMPFYKNLATFYRNSGQLKLAIETNLLIISRNKFDFNSYYELSGIYDFKNHKNELNFLLNRRTKVYLHLEQLFYKTNIYHIGISFHNIFNNVRYDIGLFDTSELGILNKNRKEKTIFWDYSNKTLSSSCQAILVVTPISIVILSDVSTLGLF